MVRGSALRQVGLMDSDYFIWFEGVDRCYRARRDGHELCVVPALTARHEGGASFRSWSTQTRVFQFYRAFFRFVCKHRLDDPRRFALPVDNSSTDDSVAYVRSEHPEVDVLALSENVGYAAGANAGLLATAGRGMRRWFGAQPITVPDLVESGRTEAEAL